MEKFLIIVGRSPSDDEFATQIKRLLPKEFYIKDIHSLGSFSDVDNKERFIAFIVTENEIAFEAFSEALVDNIKSQGFGSAAFENEENALEYAASEYGLEVDDEERERKFLEHIKQFPLFSAEEWEQFQIFDALYHVGRIQPMRARYNGEPVMILANITSGVDEIRITPMVILINDEIHEEIEIPTD